MSKFRSLKSKIFFAMITVVIAMLLLAGIVLTLSIRNISNTLYASNAEMAETSEEASLSSLTELTQDRLLELAENKAGIANHMFRDFEQAVLTVASAARRIYAGEEDYPPRTVLPPEAKKTAS